MTTYYFELENSKTPQWVLCGNAYIAVQLPERLRLIKENNNDR